IAERIVFRLVILGFFLRLIRSGFVRSRFVSFRLFGLGFLRLFFFRLGGRSVFDRLAKHAFFVALPFFIASLVASNLRRAVLNASGLASLFDQQAGAALDAGE